MAAKKGRDTRGSLPQNKKSYKPDPKPAKRPKKGKSGGFG